MKSIKFLGIQIIFKAIKPDTNQIFCCLGKDHTCPLNVNDGYCAAKKCQYQVEDKYRGN